MDRHHQAEIRRSCSLQDDRDRSPPRRTGQAARTDEDGGLSLDAGPFVAALEYASGRTAHVIGKPSDAFFCAALEDLALDAAAVAIIGDDVEADVGGAMTVGMAGVLVRTGKYKDGDETKIDPAPTNVSADLMAAADWILGMRWEVGQKPARSR